MLKLSKIIKWVKNSAILILAVLTILLLLDYFFPLPVRDVQGTRVVVAEDDTPLWRFADREGVWQYPITLDEISPYYVDALLAYEDRWFYKHWGINPFSMLRASWQYIKNRQIVSGGSTLTMQVARLIEPHAKNIPGKLRQIFRALQLEWHYSKNEILTLYLNRAPYGGTIQGVGAASWVYLGKPPSELTPGEAALLAILPQAPSRLRPDRYPKRAKRARDKLLDRLVAYHVWNNVLIDEIREEEIWLAPRQSPKLAPLLARKLVKGDNAAIIKTTINAQLQQILENLVSNWKNQLPPKTSLGLLIVDHTNMAVKAYIGSIDLSDSTRFGHVDMINAWRSPGSTLKPFLYAMAMDEGLIHSESLLQDVPRITSDYRPANFDMGFYGPVSTSEALLRSLNLPAVQLMETYGAKKFTAKLRQAGLILRSQANNEPNLSFILGGAAVRMDQLLMVYSAFARGGKSAQLRYLTTDPLIEQPLFSSGAAWIIRRILGGDAKPGITGYITDIAPFAWKTGTSYGYRDAWAIGFGPRYLIGVWVGRPDGTPVPGQYGNATAVPLLHQTYNILSGLQQNTGELLPKDPKPRSVNAMEICWPLGQPLPKGDSNCHRRKRAWILDYMTPLTLSLPNETNLQSNKITIWTNTENKRVAADCPDAIKREVALWPIAVENWIQPREQRNHLIPPIDANCPIINDNVANKLMIVGLQNNQLLRPLPNKQEVSIRLTSQGGKGKQWWFLNGELQTVLQQGQKFELTLTRSNNYRLLLLDESGQLDRINFVMEK